MLFAVNQMHPHAEFPVEVFGNMLCRVDGAVLSARTAEAYAQMGESALQIAGYVGVCQCVHMLEEAEYLAVFLQKADAPVSCL